MKQEVKFRRLLSALVALVAGTIIVAAACAPAAAPAPTAAPTQPTAVPAAAATPTGAPVTTAPKRGGEFIAMQSRDAASLDPLASQIYSVPDRISMVYPRLITYDKNKPNDDYFDTVPKPGWATESWEFSPDGKKLTFHLKKGIKYQNLPPVNGRELTSEDVKYSIWRYKTHPTSVFKPRFEDVGSIDTPDKYTVVFNLTRPTSYIIYALSAESAWIAPPEIEQQYGDYKQVLVGAGPFIHEKTVTGEGSFFKRNPDYFEADKIYLDSVVFKVVVDVATRLAAMRGGQAAWGGDAVSKSDLDRILKTNPDMKYVLTGVGGMTFIAFNLKNPAFQDLRVRKGLSKSVNHQEIIDRLLEGLGSFQNVVPSTFGKWALSDEEIRKFDAFIYDPVAGKRLLDEAGFKLKTIQVYFAPRGAAKSVMELFAPVWDKELGIKVEPATAEYNTFSSNCYNNKFQDICVFFGGFGDPVEYLRARWYPGGSQNAAGLNDPKVNDMIYDITGTLDEQQRLKKVLDFQRYTSENVLSMLNTPGSPTYTYYPPWLKNFVPAKRPPGGLEWIIYTWIDK